ncbi:hypothetical protein CBS147332_6380 [Penicillium roqueforti]|nr:hypothetical protein CBS147332_6380 [Penicillium roqueforti]KAI3110986.1 hypothetical protein CBS147331_4962 [Penicillium roqueforti]
MANAYLPPECVLQCLGSMWHTGAPGSAEKGTNGCISNCGTETVRGAALDVVRNIAYFEGYSLSSRDCLYQDASQINGKTTLTGLTLTGSNLEHLISRGFLLTMRTLVTII